MNYPLISEYTESILSAEDNFNELANLRPVLDSYGRPVMSSGNFAVVYKMRDIVTDKLYAVKCFTREQTGREQAYKQICSKFKSIQSPYFVRFSYHEAELFIDSSQTDETEFPIVVMEWVEGLTLDKYIKKFQGNPFVLYELCYNFRIMAKWLVCQHFAHGDIKPDNILVKADGSLILIDYDGMFVESMHHEKAREQGTPDYRNPFINVCFNRHIDDYALAVLALSLKLISCSYNIQDDCPTSGNGLLISKEDVIDINNSDIFIFIRNILIHEPNLTIYYSTFIKALGGNHLIESDFTINNEKGVEDFLQYWPSGIFISKNRKLEEGILDSNGVIYTKDGFGVIGFVAEKIPEDRDIYIKEGTIFFYDDAFGYDTPKLNVHLPSTLRYFSPRSFNYKYSSLDWKSPWYTYHNGIIYTKDKTEAVLIHFKDIDFDINTSILGRYLFSQLEFKGNWPVNIKIIRKGAFKDSSVSSSLDIAEGVISIGNQAFAGCSASKITLPSTLISLDEYSFHMCNNLEQVIFNPDSPLDIIPNNAFVNNKLLNVVSFPKNLKVIGKSAFQWCLNIKDISFPPSLEIIEDNAFSMSSVLGDEYNSELTEIIFPSSLKKIEKKAFSCHTNLSKVTFLSHIDTIGDEAFFKCSSLTTFNHLGIGHIGLNAFYGCNIDFYNLKGIDVIALGALNGCKIHSTLGSSFIIKNDCLYSENFKELIYCWSNENIIEIEEGVKDIQRNAFLNTPVAIVLPNSFDEDNLADISFVPVLVVPRHFKERNESEGSKILHNKVYVDSEGVIYSEDKQALILFPRELELEAYSIIDGCQIIKEHAFEEEVVPDPEFGVFYYGNNLKHIQLPNSLRIIEQNSFSGCHKILSIDIPDSVLTIGSHAFSSCENLTEVILPSSIIELGESAFASLTNVVLPINGSLRYEGGCILSSDNTLIQIPSEVKSLNLPEVVSYHGKKCHTYNNCLVTLDGELIWIIPKIEHFIFPDSVSVIGMNAFNGNDKIKELIIPEGVTEIGYYAFGYNQALEDIYLPKSMKKIHSLKTYQGRGRKYIENFYPKRIHIPKGMRNHFKKLMPNIPDSKLIEY